MPINTRNQRFAGQIFDQVQTVTGERDKYKAMAEKLPILIRTAGLAQALAFVNASKESGHKSLLKHLAEVVGDGTIPNLLERSRTDELLKYMRLTQETLAALLWYKRFAQAAPPPAPQNNADNQANQVNQGGQG